MENTNRLFQIVILGSMEGNRPDLEDVVPWGEVPAPLNVPPMQHVDHFSNPVGARSRGFQHLNEHPDIRTRVRRLKEDVVVWTSAHGTEIAYGKKLVAGLAAIGLAATGAVILYKNGRRMSEQREERK